MKLNYKRTFFVGLAFLGICAFWQMYDNIIPLMLQETFGLGETATGTLMAMDNVLALFLLPVFGTLSDKLNTPLGKRTPFILAGTLLSVICMMLLPFADKVQNLVFFMVALFATLLAMGIYRSPAVALMPDLTPNRLRSRANAIINLMGAIGGVYTLVMIMVLVGDGERPDYTPLFISVAASMVIALAVLLFTIRENKLRKEVEEAEAALAAQERAEKDAKECEAQNNVSQDMREKVESCGNGIAEEQKPDGKNSENKTALPVDVKRSMIFMLLSVAFWYMAYNAVTTAFSRYTKEVWKLEGGGFANCLLVATVAAIISYVPIGNISAKIGRKKTIMAGVALMSVCYGVAVFVGSYYPVINVAFALIGVGWAAINVNSYPMVVAMGKDGDIGKFTGTYYTFSMAAQVLTPVLSGALLENVSYRTLFPYAFVFSVLAFFTMIGVRHGDVAVEKKQSILEHFDVED